MEWFKEWFDENYLELFLKTQSEELTKKQVDFIIDVLNLSKGDRVLDIGCGIGRHLIELAKRRIMGVGIDVIDRFIEIAQKNKKDLDIEFLKMDEREMDFLEEFDGAISMWTSFGYFSDEENLSVLRKIQTIDTFHINPEILQQFHLRKSINTNALLTSNSHQIPFPIN